MVSHSENVNLNSNISNYIHKLWDNPYTIIKHVVKMILILTLLWYFSIHFMFKIKLLHNLIVSHYLRKALTLNFWVISTFQCNLVDMVIIHTHSNAFLLIDIIKAGFSSLERSNSLEKVHYKCITYWLIQWGLILLSFLLMWWTPSLPNIWSLDHMIIICAKVQWHIIMQNDLEATKSRPPILNKTFTLYNTTQH